MQPIEDLIARLDALEQKQNVLFCLSSVLEMDEMTAAPAGGAEWHCACSEYVAEEKYRQFASETTGALLRELNERRQELPEKSARQAEFLLREYNRMRSIPQEEYVRYEGLISEAGNVWVRAKRQNDFAAFAPYLEKIVAAKLRFIDVWDPSHAMKPYDVLLSEYEYGLTSEALDQFFGRLKEVIVPLVAAIREKGIQPDVSFLHGDCPVWKQQQLSDYLMQVLTIDREHCAITETEHPFTLNFNKDDVRITTHYHADDVMSSFYSVVHEGGHALYELHIGDELKNTSLGTGASMSIHESQSRFFENFVGRSRGFCDFILPKMKELFPENFANVTEEEFYHAVNRSEPSLIRTEADELTYCLHVMVRYEIEKMLINREIQVSELPAVWNAKIKEYLGIDVPDDTHGVLQDSHWSGGSLGYFPSYALGNAYGAQIAEVMKKELDFDKCMAEGNLHPVVSWLTEHVFRFGCLYDPMPLLEKVCGEKFSPEPYLRYLTEKYSALYGLQ